MVLFWNSLVNLKVEGSHKYYIDATIDKNTSNQWCFIGFYSEPETTKKSETWNKLRLLNSDPIIPWLCVRDFNEITKQDEKLGGVGLITKCNCSEMLLTSVASWILGI